MEQSPDRQGLRRFALQISIAFPLIFMLLLPLIFGFGVHWWPLVPSAVLLGLRQFYVPGLRPIYWLWMRIARIIGKINTFLILVIVYAVLVTPLGALLRMFKKLQYQHSMRPHARSLWVEVQEPPTPDDLSKPY